MPTLKRGEPAADYPQRNAHRLRIGLFVPVFPIQNYDQCCKPPKYSHFNPDERIHEISPS